MSGDAAGDDARSSRRLADRRSSFEGTAAVELEFLKAGDRSERNRGAAQASAKVAPGHARPFLSRVAPIAAFMATRRRRAGRTCTAAKRRAETPWRMLEVGDFFAMQKRSRKVPTRPVAGGCGAAENRRLAGIACPAWLTPDRLQKVAVSVASTRRSRAMIAASHASPLPHLPCQSIRPPVEPSGRRPLRRPEDGRMGRKDVPKLSSRRSMLKSPEPWREHERSDRPDGAGALDQHWPRCRRP